MPSVPLQITLRVGPEVAWRSGGQDCSHPGLTSLTTGGEGVISQRAGKLRVTTKLGRGLP